MPAPLRYCAFKGKVCGDPPKNTSANAVFAAYSSNPRIAENMRTLADRSNEIGAEITTWERLSKGKGSGVIFCDICRQMEKSAAVFCEVTDWNQNVVFEMGFAVGRGKPIVTLKDSLRNLGRDFPMMRDIRYTPYQNVGEMVSRLSSIDWRGEDANRLFDTNASPGLRNGAVECLYLKGGVATDSANAIEKELKRAKWLSILVDDPNDSFSHVWYDLSEKVAASDLVIAHLVSNEVKDSAQLNAKTSLLAGLALATGKRLLVLQEQPADTMIDLQGVRKEYVTPSEARELTERWLGDQLRARGEIEASRPQKVKNAAKPQALQLLKFGEPAAENDSNLLEYFVEMPTTDEAISGRRHFFGGRRGSGKSAAGLFLREKLNERPHNVVRLVQPLTLQFATIKDTLDSHFDGKHRPYVYEALWRFVIYTELIEATIEGQQKLRDVNISGAVQHLEKFWENHLDDFEGDFDDRLRRALDKAAAVAAEESVWDQKGKIFECFHGAEIGGLDKALHVIAKEKQLYLVLDNLDQDWGREGDTQHCVHLLVGLLAEAQKVNAEFAGRANVIVFLRTDIVDAIREADVEADKRFFFDIAWDAESLLHMIAVRIARSLDLPEDAEDPRDLWQQAFAPTVRGVPTADYILERTLMRPRDLIWYCSIALDRAKMRGHERITEEDVLAAEKQYSTQILKNVVAEYPAGTGDLESLALCLMGGREEMSGRQLAIALRDALEEEGTAPLWDAAETLYRAGIAGTVGASGTLYCYLESDFARAVTRNAPPLSRYERFIARFKVQGARGRDRMRRTRFRIHPAFRLELDVSG